MVWALLFALGVGVLTLTLFGARLTKRRRVEIRDQVLPSIDPADPWAAWRPRPLDDLDPPRPRLWPLLATLTGLVLLGAGFAGTRQTLWGSPAAAPEARQSPATPVPYEVDLPATPSPTAEPSLAPATPRPVRVAATPRPSAPPAIEGPDVSGTASCAAGSLTLHFSVTAKGSPLAWLTLWVDGNVAKGGPLSGTSYAATYTRDASRGDHTLEVAAQDRAGHTTRRQWPAHCA